MSFAADKCPARGVPLTAVPEVENALFIHDADVTRVKPTILRESLGVCLYALSVIFADGTGSHWGC